MKKLILISGILCLVFTGVACQEDTAYQEESVISFNGLEWLVGPDVDTNWYEAEEWVNALGEGWRLPTIFELQELYRLGITESNWGPFENSGFWVWSGEIRDSSSVWGFFFQGGSETYVPFDYDIASRTFAVRNP